MFTAIIAFFLAALFGIFMLFGNLFSRPEPPPEPTTTTTTTTSTTTTTTTAVTTTTVPETTTEMATRTPVVIAIDRDALMAAFAGEEAVQRITAFDAIGREQNRTFTGVAIRDILAHNGVDLNDISSTARLVLTTVNADGTVSSNTPATHSIASYANFMAETTLLAWHEINHDADDAETLMERPRLVFGDETEALWGQFAQRVTAITLYF